MSLSPPLLTVAYLSIPTFLISLVVATRPTPIWRLFAFCLIASICLSGYNLTFGLPSHNYTIGSKLSASVLAAVQFLYLSNPLDEYRHVTDRIPAKNLPLWRRVYWVACLVEDLRGVGWNYQVCINLHSPSLTAYFFATGSECSSPVI